MPKIVIRLIFNISSQDIRFPGLSRNDQVFPAIVREISAVTPKIPIKIINPNFWMETCFAPVATSGEDQNMKTGIISHIPQFSKTGRI
jgi:hypothetical protein